jgi:uncharacterized protein YbjT (DUF2867 family)
MKILIAGASGFIGRQLTQELTKKHHVIALSRSEASHLNKKNLTWIKCDLFSLKELEDASKDIDVGIYLIHSMAPSSRLVQGSFSDIDLLLADNFRRAMNKASVKKIVYLGGLVPRVENPSHLSRHLKSRLEVEQTLAECTGGFYAIRAGLIIGPGGSSFEMMANLVRRLPLMVCPRWTQNKSHPIALSDVVQIITSLVDADHITPGIFDIGGHEQISYVDLMKLTGKILGRQPRLIMTKIFSLSLSKLWVSLFGSAPMELVAPLIESLKHEMTVSNWSLQKQLGIEPAPIEDSLRTSLLVEKRPRTDNSRFALFTSKRLNLPSIDDVISVQRISKPTTWTAVDVAKDYANWLHLFFRPVLKVVTDEQFNITFYFAPIGLALIKFRLLSLSFSSERSHQDRVLFYLAGGLLDRESSRLRGRLEFREVLGGTKIITAVLRFRPRLPWFIYLATQAKVHVLVMRSFNRRLTKINR